MIPFSGGTCYLFFGGEIYIPPTKGQLAPTLGEFHRRLLFRSWWVEFLGIIGQMWLPKPTGGFWCFFEVKILDVFPTKNCKRVNCVFLMFLKRGWWALSRKWKQIPPKKWENLLRNQPKSLDPYEIRPDVLTVVVWTGVNRQPEPCFSFWGKWDDFEQLSRKMH